MKQKPNQEGRPYPPMTPNDGGHSDATGHMRDVAGPPAQPNRQPGVPMAGPTTRSKQ